ncbi:MAG: hypothetical protein AABZ84_05920 [Pseudomonadota bacterium]
MAINKGIGQYQTTIGFVDVLVHACCTVTEEGSKYHEASGRVEAHREHYTDDGTVGVEVKIGEVGVGDILRQINLYRSYINLSAWVLAVAYPLTEATVTTLRNEHVLPIFIGVGFGQWAATQPLTTIREL